MKNYILFTLLLVLAIGCEKDDLDFSENIIGKWEWIETTMPGLK